MAGNPKGSPFRSMPDRDRGTVNARFRVLRETNDLVGALAERLGDTKTNVAVALARVGARHEAELLEELRQLREPEGKSTDP